MGKGVDLDLGSENQRETGAHSSLCFHGIHRALNCPTSKLASQLLLFQRKRISCE